MGWELETQVDIFCLICPEEYTDVLLEIEDGTTEVLQKLSVWAYLLHFYHVCLCLQARILKRDPTAWLPFSANPEEEERFSKWLKEFCAVSTSKSAVKVAQQTYFEALYHPYFFYPDTSVSPQDD